jgi:hypothetical protein
MPLAQLDPLRDTLPAILAENMAKALNLQGSDLYEKEAYADGLQCLLNSHKLSLVHNLRENTPLQVFNLSVKLGDLYHKQKSFSRALEFYNDGLGLCRALIFNPKYRQKLIKEQQRDPSQKCQIQQELSKLVNKIGNIYVYQQVNRASTPQLRRGFLKLVLTNREDVIQKPLFTSLV